MVIYGLNFSFKTQFLRFFCRKNRKSFTAGPFFSVFWMIVYRGALIPRKLTCPKVPGYAPEYTSLQTMIEFLDHHLCLKGTLSTWPKILIKKSNTLKELRNYILCIIQVWSLFCSVPVNTCSYFLPILLVKLGFFLSVFFMFLHFWYLIFNFSVLILNSRSSQKTFVLSGA